MKTFNSVSAQSLNYLSRPHCGLPRAARTGPAAWKSADFPNTDSWIRRISPAEAREIEALPGILKKSGKTLGELTPADCPVPILAPAIAAWRAEITSGRGFLVVRGIPVEKFSPAECETIFWCLGLHLGIPGAQNSAGDLLTHVTDEGKGDGDASRLYKTTARIAYHCDAADIVGLLFLASAPAGGRSRIASSVSVYNELARTYPEDAKLLFSPLCLDTRGENGLDFVRVPALRFDGEKLRTFYHSDYFRSAERHASARREVEAYRQALDRYEAIADSPEFFLEMDLAPGDAQFLSNHTMIHARTEYSDAGSVRGKRHLLRLWLSNPEPMPPGLTLLRALSRLQLLRALAAAKLRVFF